MSDQDQKLINDCWNKTGVWAKNDRNCPDLGQYGHCRNCPVYSKTGRSLLDRPLTDDYRLELIELFKKSVEPKERGNKSAFVFKAGGEWFALHSFLIKEVVNMGPIHSIPHKNSRIFRGIVNIKGQIEICVSIGGVLRIGQRFKVRGSKNTERLIVAQKDDQIVVFPVTEVLGSIRYKSSMLKPLPVTVAGSKAVYTKNILTVKGKDIGFLEDTMLFRILSRNIS